MQSPTTHVPSLNFRPSSNPIISTNPSISTYPTEKRKKVPRPNDMSYRYGKGRKGSRQLQLFDLEDLFPDGFPRRNGEPRRRNANNQG